MHFFALDVETANADRSSICSVGIVEFRDGVAVREWYSLIDPQQYFDAMNVSIHGITLDDVVGAPTFSDVYPFIEEMVGGHVVFSHMTFDETAMVSACEHNDLPALSCIWADSAKLARRAWEQCKKSGYGLKPVCEIIGFKFAHHNALEDAKACGMIVLAVAERTNFAMPDLLLLQTRPLSGKKAWSPDSAMIETPSKPKALHTVLPGGREVPESFHAHPIVVFTGDMAFPREEMEGMALRNGFIVHPGIRKDITHLVVGDNDWNRGYVSGKRKKAEDYITRGINIHILSETQFREDFLGLGGTVDPLPEVKGEEVEVWVFSVDGSVNITKGYL